jgi:AcrR family transcriptional regulator
MTIPGTSADAGVGGAQGERGWAELDTEGKRERLLRAAGEVFARGGLDAPMPTIAAAARTGVGSVYRQFSSKEDLLAALIVERLHETEREAREALASEQAPWPALVGLVESIAARQVADPVLAEGIATVSSHEDVAAALADTILAFEALLAACKAEGTLREDATTLDVRLLLSAVRAAARLEPSAWPRMLELGIDALRASGSAR